MTETQAPTRTLTFLFTDIEGSTRLWETFPQAMRTSLARHDEILRAAVERSGGQVVKTTGDGLMAVFGSSHAALVACLEAQVALAREPWGETGPLRVRMGMHTGEVPSAGVDYHGQTVNRAARIMAAGHGGQVLLSFSAASIVLDDLPENVTLRDLGEQHLKDLDRPERVFQLVHPDLVATFPALATADTRAYELPRESSAFVGRTLEVERLEERLLREDAHLITLTGPGGIGKTRLALRAARAVRPGFAQGAAFVDLSSVRDTSSALLAISRELGLPDGSEKTQFDDLSGHLRDQQLLLVLDNFEQVMQAAPAVGRLLRECSRLKVLVTSREPLHLQGEYLFPLQPLGLPPEDIGSPTAASLEDFEAVRFFFERAQAVRPDFRITDDNAAAVLEICRRLDGLPLAIELATARLALFTPEVLRDRLASGRAMLQSRARDLPQRQQTLRDTIEWSYQLLESTEQHSLCLLSIFGGTTLEDLEAVSAELPDPEALGDPLESLASLVDKSLVVRVDLDDGGTRFRMLQTIRAYAAERLAQDEGFAAAARRAHASHFAAFAIAQAAALQGPSRAATLARVVPERDNLRVCWHYWLAQRDMDQLDPLADAMWALNHAKAWNRGTVELAVGLLTLLESSPETPERWAKEAAMRISLARALTAMDGFTPETERVLTRAVEVGAATQGSARAFFPALRSLAGLYLYQAQFTKAEEVGRRILKVADEQDDATMRVDGHLVLGSSLTFLNDLDGGLRELDRSIEIFEAEGYRPARRLGVDPRISSLTTSSFVLWLVGRVDTSLVRADRAIELAARSSDPFTVAYARFHTGLLHLWRRQPDVMRDRALAVLTVADEGEMGVWRAVGTVLMGAASAGLGHAEEGLAAVRSGVEQYRRLRTPPVFWPLLLYLDAWASLQAQSAADGLQRIDEAIGLVASGHVPLQPEFMLLRGDLMEAGGDATGAQMAWAQAHEVAMATPVRMSALRAVLRIARATDGDARQADWLAALGTLYEAFDEGFDLPDLVEARERLGVAPVS